MRPCIVETGGMSLDSIYQMPVLRACSFALALALIFRSDAVCQTPRTPSASECARAADRLHAEPLQEKAWGAHLAAVCKMPELAGEIGAELERLNPEER